MSKLRQHWILILFLIGSFITFAQVDQNPAILSIDRIYNSQEFKQSFAPEIQWIENGEAYVIKEKSGNMGGFELIKYKSLDQKREVFVPSPVLTFSDKPLKIESFSLSEDGSKVLIFNNSSKVWRSNTKGDFYVYDLNSKKLTQLGKNLSPSSLMFAKFSPNNEYVSYVHDFNLFLENFRTGEIMQLTQDGNGKIINGTFDWAYEEEFGKRDGFVWNPHGRSIAYWQIDAGKIGTFYMMNNTDSVYSKPIPLQYPKVGQEPSSAKIGLIDLVSKNTTWIPVEGRPTENYIPGIQWVNSDLLLIQQLNRKQNNLIVWSYRPSSNTLKKVYTETEDTWIEINYPDVSADCWGKNDLTLVDYNSAFLRMTETDGWRHIYKIDIESGGKTLLTPGDYDVASMRSPTKNEIYFMASPENSTQRYLFRVPLNGKGKSKRITPASFDGMNFYDVSPNGKYAIHSHLNTEEPRTTRLIDLPNHKTLKVLEENSGYKTKLTTLDLPDIKFEKITTEDGLEIDVRMVLPTNFDPTKKYPVLFHVYGEPWGQVATDAQIGLWNIMLAQIGYVIIDMDNRGTPCLKGSNWRKSIYRKVGIINTKDQAQAAKEVLKKPFLDKDRTAVWGWSGGGSMTLNLMFQYPEIYKTGIAVAAVSNQLIYDNIYQERYMGLPQENMEDFVMGSPINYAKNLQGNLLIIHGTGDDNVHYQSAEMLINELIKENKQFRVMPYPNRSHGIYEGENTRRHLYTLITNFLIETTPPNIN